LRGGGTSGRLPGVYNDIYTILRVAVAAVLPLWGSFSSAVAGSVTQPGSTIGTTPGMPLAQGFYFSATPDGGVRDPNTRLFVIHPVYVWSTPWTVLGARFQVMAETAFNATYNVAIHANGYYNPLFAGQLAWDLGNGFGFSYTFGAYFDVYQPLAWSSNSLNQRFALTYAGAEWNLSANMIYGMQLDAVTNRPQISPCRTLLRIEGCNPDFVNLDLTASKKFGNWELGPVAFASMDVSRPIPTYQKQSQFAAGGLVGYDFGIMRLQAYVTRDVYVQNYSGLDTREWGRITVPLWRPPQTPASSTPRKD
jgi:hypothetical protein